MRSSKKTYLNRRVSALIIALSMIAGLLGNMGYAKAEETVWDGASDVSWYTVDKDALSYEIETAQQLAGLAEIVNGTAEDEYGQIEKNDFEGVTFTLTADIVLNTDPIPGRDDTLKEWTPIGGGANKEVFRGTFDGQQYSIKNIYINADGSWGEDENRNIGLFGYIGGEAAVRDLTIKDGWIFGRRAVGAVVGRTEDYNASLGHGAIIENCHNVGTEVTSTEKTGVGGIAGAGYNMALICNCTNSGDIKAEGGYDAGGIVGDCEGIIQNCSNSGKVSSITGNAGGIVGYNQQFDTYVPQTINCYNTGEVSSGGYAGGIIGYQEGGSRNCYNVGALSGDGNNGGVIGDLNSRYDNENLYFLDSADSGVARQAGTTGSVETTEKTEDEMKGEPFPVLLNGDDTDYGEGDAFRYEAGDYPVFPAYNDGRGKVVSDIKITAPPSTVYYKTGDVLSLSGMKVMISYADGSAATEITYENNTPAGILTTLSDSDTSVAGTKTADIRYGYRTANQALMVCDVNIVYGLIADLGEIKWDSGGKLVEARSAYAVLEGDEGINKGVENYSDLETAENSYKNTEEPPNGIAYTGFGEYIESIREEYKESSIAIEGGELDNIKSDTLGIIGSREIEVAGIWEKLKEAESGITALSKYLKPSLSFAQIAVETQTYTGSALMPEIVVTYSGRTLVRNTDYEVAYSNNIKARASGKVTVTGKGDYRGTTSATFYIVQAANKIYCKDRIDKTYGATAFSLGATARESALISYASGNTSVAAVSAGGKVTIKGTGIASITVTAKSTANYRTTAKTVTIYVRPKKVSIYKVTSPKKRTLKATWKRDKKATGYQVVCATNKKFTKNKKTALAGKSKTTSKTIKNLKKGKKYYVKVRAYKTARGQKIYGSYSKVKTVRVK